MHKHKTYLCILNLRYYSERNFNINDKLSSDFHLILFSLIKDFKLPAFELFMSLRYFSTPLLLASICSPFIMKKYSLFNDSVLPSDFSCNIFPSSGWSSPPNSSEDNFFVAAEFKSDP